MKVIKKSRCYYDKEWFVFPFSIGWESRLYYVMKPTSRLTIHFLWWHWQWQFERREGE